MSSEAKEGDPPVVVKGLKLNEHQKVAYVAAQHEALVGHAHEQIVAAIEAARELGWVPDEFVVAVFDIEDPFTSQADVDRMLELGTGYLIKPMKREKLAARLREYEEPVPEAALKWSSSGRVWLRDNRTATDYPTFRPHVGLARDVMRPQTTESILIATFTYGGVRLIDAVLRSIEERPEEPQPVAETKSST